jgi:FixJ family two-component response regulator
VNKHQVKNPWGLTHGQVDVMDAYCSVGNTKSVAAKFGISLRSVECQVAKARKKMVTSSTLMAVLLWDRWRQGEGKGVPA